MLTKVSTYLLGIGIALLPATSAFGQGESESPDFARPGFYVGLGATLAVQNFDLDEAEDTAKANIDVEDTAPGLDVRAGYRFHPNIAAELHYQTWAEFGFEVEGDGTQESQINTWSLMANLKAFPLTGRIQPYGLLGLGALRVGLDDDFDLGIPSNDTNFCGRLGFGLDFYLAEHSLIYFESSYLLTTGGGDTFDLIPLTVGIQYRP
jgi:opacity protein-like surface antigen